MSKFKKMKLVPFEDSSKEDLLGDILNTIKLSTSPDLKKASTLDKDIKIILNSNINDIQKVKLYGQALKNFLVYKGKFKTQLMDPDEEESRKTIVATKSIKSKKPKKRKLQSKIPTRQGKVSSSKIPTKQRKVKTLMKSGYKKPKKQIRSKQSSIYQTAPQYQGVSAQGTSQQIQATTPTPGSSLLRYFPSVQQSSTPPFQSLAFQPSKTPEKSPIEQLGLQHLTPGGKPLYTKEYIDKFLAEHGYSEEHQRKPKPRESKSKALKKGGEILDYEQKWEDFD